MVKTFPTEILAQKTAQMLASKIRTVLAQGKPLCFLMPGGSALAVIEKLMLELKYDQLAGLTCACGDERFVAEDNQRSNAWQLEKMGWWEFVQARGGSYLRLLPAKNAAAAAKKFNTFLQTQLANQAYILSFQGIGEDGHTAGIFPAEKSQFHKIYENGKLAIAHNLGPDETKVRITITPTLLQKVQQFVIYAQGEKKQPALKSAMHKLYEHKMDYQQLPILLTLKIKSIIFTDFNS